MNTQTIAVVSLVLLALCAVIYRLFAKPKDGGTGSACDSCTTGCELRDLIREKRKDCEKNTEKTKKC